MKAQMVGFVIIQTDVYLMEITVSVHFTISARKLHLGFIQYNGKTWMLM